MAQMMRPASFGSSYLSCFVKRDVEPKYYQLVQKKSNILQPFDCCLRLRENFDSISESWLSHNFSSFLQCISLSCSRKCQNWLPSVIDSDMDCQFSPNSWQRLFWLPEWQLYQLWVHCHKENRLKLWLSQLLLIESKFSWSLKQQSNGCKKKMYLWPKWRKTHCLGPLVSSSPT